VVGVAVSVGVGEGVPVGVGEGVAVGVCVGVAVGVGAAVGVAVGLAVAADVYVRKNMSQPAGLVSSYGGTREKMPPAGYGLDGPSPRRKEPVLTMRAYLVPGVTATGAGRSMCCSPGFTTTSPVDPSRLLVANSRSSTAAVLGVWK